VPKNSGKTFLYYRQSVRLNDQMLAIYFFVSFVLVSVAAKRLFWLPILFQAALLLKYYRSEHISARVNLLLNSIIICGWTVWYVVSFGWGVGGQHLLFVLVLLVFFCLYETPVIKICYLCLLLALRMLLFHYTSMHPPRYVLDSFSLFLMQTVNSVSLFLILAGMCIVYSSNLQEKERQLLLNNEKLQQEAETDPLTGLINRRGLHDIMDNFVRANPEAMYCIAIADIDLFKRVNDTYGHNCGDYTLRRLAGLFTEKAEEKYAVGRWGGEEFCFFMPGANIDDAGVIMHDVNFAVERMRLEFEGNEITITITIGVEECDFSSPLEDLLKRADEKLYMGKNSGRNKVVV
jgi:diguanylate cyclase (GGDEF)-like protein